MTKMLFFIIAIFCGHDAMALGEPVKSEIKMGEKDGCASVCHIYTEKAVYTQSCGNEVDPPVLTVGLVKKSGTSAELCKQASNQLVLRDIENAKYTGMVGDLVFIEDSMSAPGTGNLHIYSLSDGKKKISVGTNDEPVNLSGNRLIYFRSKQEVWYSENPQRWKELGCDDSLKDSLGCELLEETEVDLATFKEAGLKKTKLQSVQ